MEAACLFCRIVSKEVESVIVHEDDQAVIFLDIAPVRPGHAQVVPRAHFESFDELPPALLAHVMDLAQQLARRMKDVYGVPRVGLVFSGGDVAHAHAHVIPMHRKGDITSARYARGLDVKTLSDAHLRMSAEQLAAVREQLAFTATAPTGQGP